MGQEKSYVCLQGGWVGQKICPKHAYVIYEWSLTPTYGVWTPESVSSERNVCMFVY